MSDPQMQEEDVIISRGSTVEGKIASGGTVRVAGKVSGEIACQVLVVLQGGVVSGVISAKEAHIAGNVGEEVKVENTLHIDGTGIVSGKCSYGVLEIVRGGQLNGHVSCLETRKANGKTPDTIPAERVAARQGQKTGDPFIESFGNGELRLPS
jgi:cytoskeletal protein CcmA (bactofilin family)